MLKKYIQILFIVIINILVAGGLLLLLPDSITTADLLASASIINIILAFLILANKKPYEEKLTWILIILFLPIIGLFIYLFFGLDYRLIKKNRGKKYDPSKLAAIENNTIFPKTFYENFTDELDFIELINNLTHKPITFHNKTTLLNNGNQFFPQLFDELKKAQEYINLEYFIIKNSEVANTLIEILVERANDGVEVRCLFDYFGALNFDASLINLLKANGIKVQLFNPLSIKIFLDGLNYRNHRKITVIDGKVGFTGGMNISDEYNHKNKYYGFWRDSHLMIEGDAVKSLNIVFMKDWYYATKEDIMNEKYLKAYPVEPLSPHSGVQILDDGPDIVNSVMKDVYFKAIMEAQKDVRIATPYLVPDSEILQALKISAMSGVNVQIIIPGKPDKKLVYIATQSYFQELLTAGCKIYFYGKNFMHSKIMVIDDKIASIGTTNIDFRSFHLHFENTALLYKDPTINEIISAFNDDLLVSNEIILEEWKKRGYHRRLIEAFTRLFSPLF